MQKLTARQGEILAFLKGWMDSHGYPPTRAEMAQHLGFRSPNAAEEHLRALARKGAIEMVPGASRGIRFPSNEPLPHADGLPIIGRVAAGAPILATPHIEDSCRVPADFFHPPADFLLRVRGMSMKEAGILEGDLIAVHACREAHDGQIVVARIGDEVTVKRFQRRGRHVVLQAENSEFAPIIIEAEDNELFSIEGLCVGVIRR